MTTKCVNCDNPAKVNLSYSRPYCKNHFIQIIKKRVKKELRGKLDLEKEYTLKKEDNLQFEVNKKLLRMCYPRIKLKTSIKNFDIENKYAQHLAQELLEAFTTNKPIKTYALLPLKSILEEDLINLKKLFSLDKKLQKPQQNHLKSLENKYPGTIFSVLKSLDSLKEIENNPKK